VNKARLIEKIADLVREKRIEGIHALRDESDKDGMLITIEIKRDAIGKVVLNNLYSITQLQTSFGINMVALHQGQPKTMSIKDIIKVFILHRREIVTRRTIFELRKAYDRAHILEGLSIALANIESTIKLVRHASTVTDARSNMLQVPWLLGKITPSLHNIRRSLLDTSSSELVESRIKDGKYYLTDKQAHAILDLKLQKLTDLEHTQLLEEYKQLSAKINKLNNIIENPEELTKVICSELVATRSQFNDSRRTEIISDTSSINTEDLIVQEDVVVTFSYQGYVKYQPLSDYDAQRRGGRGKSAVRTKKTDFIERILVVNTHSTILCFSSKGRLYWMKVYNLPEASRGSRGRPIINLLPLESGERITAILPVSEYTIGLNIFMVTAMGTVKKTLLQEFSRPRSKGIIALNLRGEDKLVGVELTNGSNEIMLFSNAGKVMRFSEKAVRAMSRTASGIRGIKLSKNDRVVSLVVPRNEGTILTITQNGYGKRTPIKDYPIKSRATHGVISIKVNERNGPVVGSIYVEENDQVMMITDTGTLARTCVSEIGTVSRNTQGVTLIRILQNEKVVSLQRVIEASKVLNNANSSSSS
jgi:DNA gyrase subunit A